MTDEMLKTGHVPSALSDTQLKSPLRLTVDYASRMNGSGVALLNGTPHEGFSHLQGHHAIGEIISRLYWMDSRSFEIVINRLPDDLFSSVSRVDVITLQQLARQRTPEPDGYYARSIKRPVTWSLNELIPAEIFHLKEQLRNSGIDEIKVGLEIEFAVSDDPVLNNTKWLEVRDGIVAELKALADHTDEPDKSKLEEKRKSVEQFNAREIMMYDLLEKDPRTQGLLEPLFGTTRDGDGYYDALGMLELKLKQDDPERLPQNRRVLLNVLYEKASDYGLIFEDIPSYHVNMSFWRNGENVLDSSHPDFTTAGKAIVEGITRAAFDFIPTLIDPSSINEQIRDDVRCTVNRDSFLRFATGRIELRPMTDGEYQDPDFYTTMMMAGALDGLKDNSSTPKLSSNVVDKAQVLHSPGQFKVTSHVLGNSIIARDGSLIPPEDYILEHADVIAVELGIIPVLPDDLSKKRTGLEWFSRPADYAPYLIEFFKAVKVDPESNTIIFPTNCLGVYEIKTPKDYTHLLPGKLQQEIRKRRAINDQLAGFSLVALNPRQEYQAFRYMIDNRLFPEAIQDQANVKNTYHVDVKAINRGISVRSVAQFLVVDPGYNSNALPADEDTTLLESRLSRMINSSLRDSTTPVFRNALMETINALKPQE